MDKIGSFLLQFSLELKNKKVLEGGQLHRCYWVLTDQGPLVVKELVSSVRANANFLSDYEQSEKIANLFSVQGAPAVGALKINGHYVHEYEGNFYIVYPAVKGKVLKARQIRRHHAQKIGKIFAQLHELGTHLVELNEPNYLYHTQEEWREICALSTNFVDDILAGKILHWNELYREKFLLTKDNLLTSHRDLHYGNLIWDEGNEPHIIDWESAGSIDAEMEIVGFALEWSGLLLGEFNASIFSAILQSYLNDSQKEIKDHDRAFYGWLGHSVLGWLFFNLRRALGLTSSDPLEKARATAVLEGGLLRALNYLGTHEQDLLVQMKQTCMASKYL